MGESRQSRDPLENLLAILLARKVLAIVGFLVVFAMTVVGSFILPSSYEAYTSIFISAPAASYIGIPSAELSNRKSFLVNQINIIRSRKILEKVVLKLGLDKRPIKKGLLSRVKDDIYYYLKIMRPFRDPVEEAIERARDMLSVNLPRRSSIAILTVKSTSADFSALLANTVANTYVEYAHGLLRSSTQSGYSFLEDEFSRAQEKLRESEGVLDAFNKREMVFTMPAENSVIAQKLSEMEETGARIRAQLEYLKKEVVSGGGSETPGTLLSPVQYANPEVKALKEELKKLNADLSNALTYLKEDHPDVRALRHRIQRVEEKIKATADNDGDGSKEPTNVNEAVNVKAGPNLPMKIEELENKEIFISDQIKKLMARRQELTEKQVEQERLAREVSKYRERVDLLKTRLEDARALKARNIEFGSIKIVDAAFPPPFPSKRKKIILLAIGSVVGIIFGIGMAFVAEYFDESLETADQVEEYLNVEVLGVVPRVNGKL